MQVELQNNDILKRKVESLTITRNIKENLAL